MVIGQDCSLLPAAISPVQEDGDNVTQECDINNEEPSLNPDLTIRNSPDESPDTHCLGASASSIQVEGNAPSTTLINGRKRKRASNTVSSSSSGSENSVCSIEQELKAERIGKIALIEERIYKARLNFQLGCIEQERQQVKRKWEIEENVALAEERAAKARGCLAEMELEAARKKYLS